MNLLQPFLGTDAGSGCCFPRTRVGDPRTWDGVALPLTLYVSVPVSGYFTRRLASEGLEVPAVET